MEAAPDDPITVSLYPPFGAAKHPFNHSYKKDPFKDNKYSAFVMLQSIPLYF